MEVYRQTFGEMSKTPSITHAMATHGTEIHDSLVKLNVLIPGTSIFSW